MDWVKDAGDGVNQLCELFVNLIAEQAGVTAIEYAMIAALIAVVIVTVVTSLGTTISSIFSTISASI